jgi:hypothetical protein
MMRPSPVVFAMHRPRSGRPVASRRQVTIHNTAYGLIETLRLKVCTQKDTQTPALPGKLSANHHLQEKHIRVKRKPNTISQKRKVYINNEEYQQ